jgi:hypothetical protein
VPRAAVLSKDQARLTTDTHDDTSLLLASSHTIIHATRVGARILTTPSFAGTKNNMVDGKAKSDQLYAALESYDPLAVARALDLPPIAKTSTPTEPRTFPPENFTFDEVDYSGVLVALLDAAAAAEAVSTKRENCCQSICFTNYKKHHGPSFCARTLECFFIFISLLWTVYSHGTTLCFLFTRVMPVNVTRHKRHCIPTLIVSLVHPRGIGWFRHC